MSDVDISHLFKRRQVTERFTVWYEPDTGDITGMAPESESDSGTFITSTSPSCIQLLSGNVSLKEYIVAYDPELDDKRLMHISEWTKLLGEKHELQIVDFVEEQDNTTQFFLNFYQEQKTCELIINHESFLNLFKQGNEEQVSSSQSQNINFYVRDKDTGYLVARYRFDFDMTNDAILESTADWLGHTDINEVEILSHKNFCTYNWSWQERRVERVIRVNRTRVIPAARSDDYAHVQFTFKDGKLICKSHIVDPSNYGMYENFKVWITHRQHPDALIGQLKIPIDKISNKQSTEVSISHMDDFDFNEVDFLTDNQYIKVHMKEIS